MSRIGKSELVYGEIMTFDQILKAVADVSSSDIRALADEILHSTPTLAVVGPFSKRSVFERVLK
jgi:predicted Zn-dependent peptidase